MKRIEYQLKNGIDVILQPMPTAPVVACNVWVGVGSADERPDEAGLAHVHEHMLFKGTESRGVGEIARDIETAGGHINAFPSFDQTCYYVVLSSRFFDAGLDILSDAIGHSSFDEEELERELEVIQEEIKRGDDNPGRVVSRLLFEMAFSTHPYRLPIIGTSESVASFERQNVVDFYEHHYTPDNLALIVVGDFEVDDAKERIESYFGSLSGPDYTSPVRAEEPPQTDTRAAVKDGEVRQNRLRVGFHIPDVRHEDIPALDLLSVILGYGDASHLDRVLQREEQLVHNVFASAYTPRDAGLFVVGADFQRDDQRPQTDPQAVLERLLEETFRFRHIEAGRADIERAKTLVESQEVYGKQTIEGLAMKYGHYLMVAGDIDFEEEYYRRLRTVDAADIRRVAARYLTAKNASAALLKPQPEPAVDDDQLLDACRRAFESSRADAVHSTVPTDDAGVARVELDGGPTLLVQQDKSVETFSIRALTLGGLRHEGPDTAGLHQLLSNLLNRGTSSRSALEIAGNIESMAASLSGVAGRNSFGLGLTGLTRFFDPCFEIFADCMLGATVPDEEFSRERRLQNEKIEGRREKLGSVNFDQFCRSFFAPHPYSLPVLGNRETLQNLSPELARKHLARHQAPSKMVLSVVGDITIDQVARQVEQYFAPTDVASSPEPKIPTFTGPERPSLVVGDLEKEQAHVIVGFPAPVLSSEEVYAVDALFAVLSGQGGRLFYELRDRQSLAYSVFARRILGLDASSFTIRIATSPEKISRAVDGIRRELDKLRDGVLTDDDLDRARRYLIGNHDIGLQRNSSRAMSFGLDELYGLGYQRSLQYGDHIDAVTLDDVQQVIDTWLKPQRMLVSIIKPPEVSVDADRLDLHLIGEQ